jgi:hypothetical protein
MTLGTEQRASIFGMSRHSVPDLIPQPPANGSLQHKVSRSKPAGSVQTSFAHVNLLPPAVLGEDVLPLVSPPPPQADNTASKPNANGHAHCFIASPADDAEVALVRAPWLQAMLGAKL